MVEHLPKLKEKGLNLYRDDQLTNQDDPPTPITKEKVVTFLRLIGQHELAQILSENNGKCILITVDGSDVLEGTFNCTH